MAGPKRAWHLVKSAWTGSAPEVHPDTKKVVMNETMLTCEYLFPLYVIVLSDEKEEFNRACESLRKNKIIRNLIKGKFLYIIRYSDATSSSPAVPFRFSVGKTKKGVPLKEVLYERVHLRYNTVSYDGEDLRRFYCQPESRKAVVFYHLLAALPKYLYHVNAKDAVISLTLASSVESSTQTIENNQVSQVSQSSQTREVVEYEWSNTSTGPSSYQKFSDGYQLIREFGLSMLDSCSRDDMKPWATFETRLAHHKNNSWSLEYGKEVSKIFVKTCHSVSTSDVMQIVINFSKLEEIQVRKSLPLTPIPAFSLRQGGTSIDTYKQANDTSTNACSSPRKIEQQEAGQQTILNEPKLKRSSVLLVPTFTTVILSLILLLFVRYQYNLVRLNGLGGTWRVTTCWLLFYC